jgi:hypothetical protein
MNIHMKNIVSVLTMGSGCSVSASSSVYMWPCILTSWSFKGYRDWIYHIFELRNILAKYHIWSCSRLCWYICIDWLGELTDEMQSYWIAPFQLDPMFPYIGLTTTLT